MWLENTKRVESPNFDKRPLGELVSLLVVHSISLPPKKYGGGHIENFFQNKLCVSADPYFSGIADVRVSSHFLIDRAGAVTQFVDTDYRAWHAGVSNWRGRERCNDFSLGIELEGSDDSAFEKEQYTSLIQLTKTLMTLYPLINIDNIAGHSAIAPGRKTDPGSGFNWDYYKSKITEGSHFE